AMAALRIVHVDGIGRLLGGGGGHGAVPVRRHGRPIDADRAVEAARPALQAAHPAALEPAHHDGLFYRAANPGVQSHATLAHHGIASHGASSTSATSAMASR